MAQWKESLLCRCKDMSSSLQHPCKYPEVVTGIPVTPRPWEQRQVGFWGLLATSLTSGSVTDPV